MSDKLPSEKMILPEATSFSGSAARIWKLTDTSNTTVKWLLLVPLALCLILAAWCLVALWYFVIFGLFGILVIPFRLLSRSSRSRKIQKLQHRELLEAIRDGKMSK